MFWSFRFMLLVCEAEVASMLSGSVVAVMQRCVVSGRVRLGHYFVSHMCSDLQTMVLVRDQCSFFVSVSRFGMFFRVHLVGYSA